VVRVRQVVQEVAVEQRLALLLQADRAVELGLGFARHERGQEVYVSGGRFHVDQKIRACEAEQRAQVVFSQQEGVDIHMAGRAAQQGDGKRVGGALIDEPAYGIGALVAKEQTVQHLDL